MRTLIVGGGPAGINAALQAQELGADVTLVEAEQAGGTNLNRGPAPVRTLARAARLIRDWSSWERFGLEGSPPALNLGAEVGEDRGHLAAGVGTTNDRDLLRQLLEGADVVVRQR